MSDPRSDEQALGEKIFLGAEVERFLATTVGRYLVQRAEAQRESAVADFAAANPTDTAAIVEIQMRLRMAETFQSWLADALIEASEAARQVEAASFVD